MTRLILALAIAAWPLPGMAVDIGAAVAPQFEARVVASGLDFPWELSLGPDGQLWTTERTGKRITRIDPETGAKTTLATIDEVLVGPQHEGLLGLAFDPQFGAGSDFVYVVYTYDADPAQAGQVANRRSKIVRLRYDSTSSTLADPVEVLAGIPASNDHNAGRLRFGPDGKLYYANGDQGANQFGNICEAVRAQLLPTAEQVAAEDWFAYSGKILRLEADGGVPADNPVIEGVQSHVYSYGHRNPQGLVFATDGTLYQSEHGPKADDELNLIVAGGNYGWPHVSGFNDDLGYVYGNWSAAPDCASLGFSDLALPAAVPQATESSWSAPNYRDPLKTLWTVPNDYNFNDQSCEGLAFICWPTIAPASIDYYPADGAITQLRHALVVPSLKNGALYVFPLTADGSSVRGDVAQLFRSENRYRDIAFSADGRTIYVSTDNQGIARSATGGVTMQMRQPGAILAFTYTGE